MARVEHGDELRSVANSFGMKSVVICGRERSGNVVAAHRDPKRDRRTALLGLVAALDHHTSSVRGDDLVDQTQRDAGRVALGALGEEPRLHTRRDPRSVVFDGDRTSVLERGAARPLTIARAATRALSVTTLTIKTRS